MLKGHFKTKHMSPSEFNASRKKFASCNSECASWNTVVWQFSNLHNPRYGSRIFTVCNKYNFCT